MTQNIFTFKAAPYFLLILAVFAAYANVYGNAFLLDDEMLIFRNSFLRSYRHLGALLMSNSTAGFGGQDAFYRPLQGLIYFIVFNLADLSTTAFHAVNVVLHAANACLVYALGRKLGFHKSAVLAAALLWAVHPVHTEAVTYMSATADPLYAFFCLLGLCVLLPTFSTPRLLGASACFVLALFSKETAVVFPLLAVICLFLVNDGRLKPRLYLKTWPLWIVAALFLFLRFTVLDFNLPHFYAVANAYTDSIVVRFWTCLATLPTYARILFWPADLHMQYDLGAYATPWYSPVITGFLLVLGAFAALIWSLRKRAWTMAWAFGWFASAHALHTGILFPVNSIFLEHWLYLPSVGLFLGAAQMISAIKIPLNAPLAQRTALSATIITAIVLGALTIQQNKIWRDPIVFYETQLHRGSRSVAMYNNLAMAYADRGDNLRAIEQYRAAIKEYDVFAQTHHNLARALLTLPDRKAHIPEAIKEFNRAIEINPNFFRSYGELAVLYAETGDMEKAESYRLKGNEIFQRLIPNSREPRSPN